MAHWGFVMKHVILQVPSSENGTLMKGRVQQPVLERINVAHDFASAELLNLIIHKVVLAKQFHIAIYKDILSLAGFGSFILDLH